MFSLMAVCHEIGPTDLWNCTKKMLLLGNWANFQSKLMI